ncbi:autotransporter domain-containing protein [Luteibacter sp. dw_328]|uniref:autotransporter family protein n=1 Tax=Luteibacter sp. dw_328 TaxID=2719796 RepID=UPI001BD323B0|nr:autotransporter domain-containing protein [Luteibacter sp. dw_328]
MFRISSISARLRGRLAVGLLGTAAVLTPLQAIASTGCQVLDGLSGTISTSQTFTLNPSQAVNFNVGDTIGLTTVANQEGLLIQLDAVGGAGSVVQRVETTSQSSSDVFSQAITAGPSTLILRTNGAFPGTVINYSIQCQSARPAVTGLAPSAGPAGTVVDITGSAFLGTTAVSFGGSPAVSFTVSSDTHISAVAPPGTDTVSVAVTTDAGQATGGAFLYAFLPDAPTIGTAVAAPERAVVSFTPGGNGGAPVGRYTVTSSPGGITASGGGSPITVSGLTDGIAYTFTVAATNPVGTGSPSASSNSVTPIALPTARDVSLHTDYGVATRIDLGSVTNGTGITSVAVATPPAHGTAAVSGTVVTYTPATGFQNAADSFTYTTRNTAGDSAPGKVIIAVGTIPLPVASAVAVSTPYATAVSIDLAAHIDGAGVTGVAVVTPPVHGQISISGQTVTYTPVSTFYGGSDSFRYTARNAGGDSVAASVTIQVLPAATPSTQALSVVTSAGTPVTITPPADSTGAQAWTSIGLATAPSHGRASTQGKTLVYVPADGFTGTDTFTYQLNNAFGASAPAAVTVIVTRTGGTAERSRTVTVMPGAPVAVDLADLAPGGVARAHLVGLSPASAGQASLTSQGMLDFTSTSSFHGLVQISAMVVTAGGDTVPVSVLVLVSTQPDPSKNADALGLVNAQVSQALRFAEGQLDNIRGRLESLHDHLSDTPSFSNGLSLNVNGRPLPAQGNRGDARTDGGIHTWVAGEAQFGSIDAYRQAASVDSNAMSVSAGADVRVADRALLGMTLGYSHDNSDIGSADTRSIGKGYSTALYGSVQPGERSYVDAVLGGGGLRFATRRTDPDGGPSLTGSRNGQQWFGSLTAGLEFRAARWVWSPYGRAAWSLSSLNGFAENGAASSALAYGRQTVRSSVASVGVRVNGDIDLGWASLAPRARLEAGHDFQDGSRTTLAYAQVPSAGSWDIVGSPYGRNGNRVQLGLGLDLRLAGGWLLGGGYDYLRQPGAHDQMIRFSVNKPF